MSLDGIVLIIWSSDEFEFILQHLMFDCKLWDLSKSKHSLRHC